MEIGTANVFVFQCFIHWYITNKRKYCISISNTFKILSPEEVYTVCASQILFVTLVAVRPQHIVNIIQQSAFISRRRHHQIRKSIFCGQRYHLSGIFAHIITFKLTVTNSQYGFDTIFRRKHSFRFKHRLRIRI